MKQTVLILTLLFTFTSLYSQRFLNPTFTDITITPNIIYGNALNVQGMSQNLLLDFYEPLGDTLPNRPLIIFLHGGGFSDTAQTKQLSHIVSFCNSFALRGYTVASVDYRLDSVATGLSNRAIINAMHDAKASIRFFKANASIYKIDTSRIFLGGESAGAITSLNASYVNTMDEVLYPMTPPMSIDNSVEGNSGNGGYSSSVKATLCLCGGTRHVSTLPVFDTSAIVLTDNPALIVHGESDPIIPLAYAVEVETRLNNLTIFNQFHTFPGATHCPWFNTLPNASFYLDSLVNFTSDFLYGFTSTILDINETEEQEPHFSIYPNPASQKIIITFLSKKTYNKQIEIYNSIGVLVKTVEIKQLSTEINLSGFSKGLYYVHLSNSSQSGVKFVKN